MRKPRSSKSAAHPSVFTPAVAELVAIGAAIGTNCEPCFTYHYSEACKLGLARGDISQAGELGERVKRAPAQNMLVLADKILGTSLSTQTPVDPSPGSCCSAVARTPGASKKPKAAGHKCG
jgi:AhpD family alkylhydroperoxidase